MINIGKVIYSILSNNAAVAALVGLKIYPLIIPQNTSLPVIIYERGSEWDNSNDGSGMATSQVVITALAGDYTTSIDIANAVYAALNGYRGTVSGIKIVDSYIIDIQETYQEDCFLQKITFTIKSI